MYFNYVEVDRVKGDLGPEDCTVTDDLQDNSLSAIQSAFPESKCFIWNAGRGFILDATTAPLLVEGCHLQVVTKPGPRPNAVEIPKGAWGVGDIESPSQGAQPKRIKALQQSDDADADPLFLMHRPSSAKAIPIALLHPIFGMFQDIFAGKSGPLLQSDYVMALDCCRVMSSFYDSEDERQRAVRTVLQNWLQCDLASLKIPTGKRRQPPVTDGTAYSGGNEEWVWLWLENKLEVGYGGADPLSEAMFYAFHHTKGKDRTGLLLPSLVVEQFGPFLRVSGMVNTGEHLASEPLTSALHMLPLLPHQPCYMEQVARACAALRQCTAALRAGYDAGILQKLPASTLPHDLAEEQTKLADVDVLAAVVAQMQQQQLKRRVELSAEVVQILAAEQSTPFGSLIAAKEQALSTTNQAAQMPSPAVRIDAHASRLLYRCTNEQGNVTVVKYTTRYCPELHKILAASMLAPQLLDYSQLHGGWLKVTMEYLGSPWTSLESVLDEGDDDKIQAASAAVLAGIERLQQLDGSPWVWGDARPPNVLVSWSNDNPCKPDVRFVDFDFSGREGAVNYPGFLNPEIPHPDGVASHQPLKCLHDAALFSNCINSIKRKSRAPPQAFVSPGCRPYAGSRLQVRAQAGKFGMALQRLTAMSVLRLT